jgi:hypothetical protein
VNHPVRLGKVSVSLFLALIILANSASAGDLELSVSGAGPRQLEPTLQQSIPRDYEKAWEALEGALESGDAGRLDQYWVGVAHDKFQHLVSDEASTGVQVRYRDKSHRLQAVFYPTDGAALVLYDTVYLEVQVVRSGKILHSEAVTQKYFVLMTPAQDRWMVRVFQSVPLS